MSTINLIHFEVLNDLLLLQWDDNSENALPLKSMRDNCPCAHCSGETDVFGNIYKGPPQIMKEESYQVTGIQSYRALCYSSHFGRTVTLMEFFLLNF